MAMKPSFPPLARRLALIPRRQPQHLDRCWYQVCQTHNYSSSSSRTNSTNSLHGKRCLITGATSGIGLSIASQFAASGAAAIALVGRNEQRIMGQIENLKQQQQQSGSTTEFVPVVADVAKEVPDMNKYGDFDILVNAAGVTHQTILLSTPDEVIRQVLDTNLLGTILMSKAFVKHVTRSRLRRRKAVDSTITEESSKSDAGNADACIINISSLLGVKGGRGSSVYAASKAGVIAFSRALALECSVKAAGDSAIRVNTIVPGYVDTAMTQGYSAATHSQISDSIPLHRFGNANEIADAALFLAGNRYAHNCVLNIDGGLSAT